MVNLVQERQNIFDRISNILRLREKTFEKILEREKKKKRILIYDFGLCTEIGIRLARDGHEVYYFVPWEDAFPKSSKALIGENLDGLHRVLNFWDWVDKVDYIMFFDTYCADLVDYLRKKGYKVFGAGKSEILENNRWKMKEIQKALKLPTQKVELIKGIESLIEYLKKNKNKWIKINTFRGDIETFHHSEYNTTQAQFLGELLVSAGAKAKKLEFVVEDEIGEVEPGYDGFIIDGQYPKMAMYGYERKGIGYIGKVVPYEQLPQSLKDINDRLIPVFRKLGGRTFFSTEVRVTKNKQGFLIDPCVRSPMPVPTAIHLEIWSNLSDFLINGAEGNLIDLKPIAKYGAGISFESGWAENHWTEIDFPPENRKWIKLRMACKIEDKYYALPGFTSLGSIIGLGNTIDEAINNVKKVADTLKVKEINYSLSGLEEIKNETIQKGKKYGIPF
uniref:ATP-grasp domain-containing protein n=1 Tax=candidate division CPR3 bacterium TaxID=2268181 RepID=A0A7V3JAC7_UNCC3